MTVSKRHTWTLSSRSRGEQRTFPCPTSPGASSSTSSSTSADSSPPRTTSSSWWNFSRPAAAPPKKSAKPPPESSSSRASTSADAPAHETQQPSYGDSSPQKTSSNSSRPAAAAPLKNSASASSLASTSADTPTRLHASMVRASIRNQRRLMAQVGGKGAKENRDSAEEGATLDKGDDEERGASSSSSSGGEETTTASSSSASASSSVLRRMNDDDSDAYELDRNANVVGSPPTAEASPMDRRLPMTEPEGQPPIQRPDKSVERQVSFKGHDQCLLRGFSSGEEVEEKKNEEEMKKNDAPPAQRPGQSVERPFKGLVFSPDDEVEEKKNEEKPKKNDALWAKPKGRRASVEMRCVDLYKMAKESTVKPKSRLLAFQHVDKEQKMRDELQKREADLKARMQKAAESKRKQLAEAEHQMQQQTMERLQERNKERRAKLMQARKEWASVSALDSMRREADEEGEETNSGSERGPKPRSRRATVEAECPSRTRAPPPTADNPKEERATVMTYLSSFAPKKNAVAPKRNPPPERPKKEDAGLDLYEKGKRRASQQRWDDALHYYSQALKVQRRKNGQDHIHCGHILNDTGVALRAIGEYYGAKTALEEALYIRQLNLGMGAPEVVETTNHIWAALSDFQRQQQDDGDDNDDRAHRNGEDGIGNDKVDPWTVSDLKRSCDGVSVSTGSTASVDESGADGDDETPPLGYVNFGLTKKGGGGGCEKQNFSAGKTRSQELMKATALMKTTKGY